MKKAVGQRTNFKGPQFPREATVINYRDEMMRLAPSSVKEMQF